MRALKIDEMRDINGGKIKTYSRSCDNCGYVVSCKYEGNSLISYMSAIVATAGQLRKHQAECILNSVGL